MKIWFDCYIRLVVEGLWIWLFSVENHQMAVVFVYYFSSVLKKEGFLSLNMRLNPALWLAILARWLNITLGGERRG